jgi:hypothetical protein
MSCETLAGPLQTLSSFAIGVVHEFSDMEEMPISQWFFEFTAERARRVRLRVRMRTPTSLPRVVATCRDAAGVCGYTVR